MLCAKILILKQYLKDCLSLFRKHRLKITCLIIFALIVASIMYLFGKLCYMEYLEITPRSFDLNKRYRKAKDVTDMIDIQKRQFKMEMQTRSLQRRVKDLTVRNDFGREYLTIKEAKILIEEALRIYNSDKIGIRDYALESAGASIISTLYTKPAKLSKEYVLFGVYIMPVYSNPREILQPDVAPGKCFTFEGFEGRIRINLSGEIYVRSVTLENCPFNLLTDEEILQTPSTFQVIGLKTPESDGGIVLGEFSYDIHGPSAQNFIITDYKNYPSFSIVELYIKDNSGHFKYTSVYRFRVHGEPWWQ